MLVGPRGLSGIKGTRGFTVYDRTDQRAITGDLSTIYLWNLKTDPPQMTASIELGAEPFDVRFLASPGVIAVTNSRGIELVSTAPRSYDPARLREAHRLLLARYNKALARHGGKLDPATASQGVYDQLVAAMKAVGVTNLMSDEAGLTRLERARILNDYGYWLSQTDAPSSAVPVLTKVVELAPGRAVAHLDLANAAMIALPSVGTWQQKLALSKEVAEAHVAYQHLTGTALPGAAEFAAFNVATAANQDICHYVAGFYDRGRQAEMFGFPNPVDIDGSGKLRYVYIFHQGTANDPEIVASPKPMTHDELVYGGEPTGSVNFFISNDKSSPDFELEPHVFPFHNAYYVVYSRRGPVAVYRPGHGTVCRFTPSYTPILTVDRDSRICARALAGERFERVPTQSLRPVRELRGVGAMGHFDPAKLGAVAKVTLDPVSGPISVGYFGVASTAGRGCDLGGIAILDKNRVENSQRSRDLLALEEKTLGCDDATAFLVRVEGRTLIEMDSGQWRGGGTIARGLFQLRGEQVAPVCRIEQRAIYEPEPIQDGGDPAKR